jgi:hypothetical protein
MRHGHSSRSRRMMSPEIADSLLESLRPTRHLLTRLLADMPIGCPEYRQVNRVVQEIDGLTDGRCDLLLPRRSFSRGTRRDLSHGEYTGTRQAVLKLSVNPDRTISLTRTQLPASMPLQGGS